MECRQFFKATAISTITFFSNVLARPCNKDQFTYFTDPSGIYYSIVRYCALGELAGKQYFDRAMDGFPGQCDAHLGVNPWDRAYDSLASWNEGYIDFGREAEQNTSSVFEQCVIAIFNQAQTSLNEEGRLQDRWTSIGLGIFCGVMFLGCMTCLIAGLICERQEKQKKAKEKIIAEESGIHHVEEIVIEKLAHLPGEEPSSESSSISSDGLPRPSSSLM